MDLRIHEHVVAAIGKLHFCSPHMPPSPWGIPSKTPSAQPPRPPSLSADLAAAAPELAVGPREQCEVHQGLRRPHAIPRVLRQVVPHRQLRHLRRAGDGARQPRGVLHTPAYGPPGPSGAGGTAPPPPPPQRLGHPPTRRAAPEQWAVRGRWRGGVVQGPRLGTVGQPREGRAGGWGPRLPCHTPPGCTARRMPPSPTKIFPT